MFLRKQVVNVKNENVIKQPIIINTKRSKTRSSQITHNTNPLRPQVQIDNMDIAYPSEPNILSIYITKTIQWNVHVQS
jgi:hypothetical protein